MYEQTVGGHICRYNRLFAYSNLLLYVQVFIRRRPHAAEKAGSVGHVVLGTAAVVTPTARRSRRRVMMPVQQQQSADGGCQKYGVVEVLVKGKLQVVRAHGFVDEPPVPVRQRDRKSTRLNSSHT